MSPFTLCVLLSTLPHAPATPLKPAANPTLAALSFRALGPAVTSGRVVDLAVHPSDLNTVYVAVASGGVWKTVNNGTTWTPRLRRAKTSFSIGYVALDPTNPERRSGSALARTTRSGASATATASTSQQATAASRGRTSA